VNVAIAYNIWRYCEITGDAPFLRSHGAEMLLQIARFLVSLASFDQARGRFVIRGVMGPDEYHDAYPWANQLGIDNNAYTNVMTSWVLQRALDALDRLPASRRGELIRKLRISDAELDTWRDVSRRLFIPFLSNGVISQFEGYERLKEFEWDAYRARYGDIARLDRILEAEGDTPNRYRLSKQADTLMLFYLFPVTEVQRLLARLGYEVDESVLRRTIDFYAARTSHGSTLSRVVHAWLLARIDPNASWSLFLEALESDLNDIQGGTTREGLHIGVLASTVDLVRRGFCGVEPDGGLVAVDPHLPQQLTAVRYSQLVGQCWLDVELADGRLKLSNLADSVGAVTVSAGGREIVLGPGGSMWTTV
jgi:alpha,alpha-trehalase